MVSLTIFMTSIYTHPITYAIPIILAAALVVIAIIDASRRNNAIRGLRIFEAILGFYFILIYVWAQTTTDLLILRSGFMTRLGVTLLLIMMLSEILVSWRVCRDAD